MIFKMPSRQPRVKPGSQRPRPCDPGAEAGPRRDAAESGVVRPLCPTGLHIRERSSIEMEAHVLHQRIDTSSSVQIGIHAGRPEGVRRGSFF